MAPKKGKDAKGKAAAKGAAAKMMAAAPPPKKKKIPPPPACFKPEDLVKFKDLFKAFDEENVEMIPLGLIATMLRKIGFNPKTEQMKELFATFLEDDMVDTVQYHEFLQMIEAKMIMGDDFEIVVTKAMKELGHDDEETGFCDFQLFREELLVNWGEPLTEIEFMDWMRLATKDKTYNPELGTFNYPKFIENMNLKDQRFIPEPVNFFKLDQKTLAAMAIQKAEEERVEQEKKDAERKAREEAKRQKMIADGLIPAD